MSSFVREPPAPILRVLELAQGIAGPACGRLFAGLGHSVIKCEPPEGDLQRRRGPYDESAASLSFAVLNGNKRSVSADWGSTPGRELLGRMLRAADVVITSGAIEGDGDFHAEAIHKEFPQLVVVDISGFGLRADPRGLPEDSLLAESFAGLATVIGLPDQKPLSLGGEQSAHVAAYSAFMGAWLALRRRERTGSGDLIDVALCDTAAFMDWKRDISRAVNGKVPERGSDPRWKMLRAKDGWAGMIYLTEQWTKVVSLVGDERLTDPKLLDEAYRVETTAQWLPIIEAWARARGKKQIYEEAQAVGLPFGYAADVHDLAASDQLKARNFIRRGVETQIGPPWDTGQLPWQSGRVPGVGEHTSEIEHELEARLNARDATVGAADDTDKPVAPLEGVIVLDLGTITAGAAAGRLLADYGATVIKIESNARPDGFRKWTPPGSKTSSDPRSAADVSPLFEANNAGKYGLELDLKTEHGLAAFRELSRHAHVILENFRPNVSSRLGIDFDTIREINPDIVYLSLSSQGHSGPEANYSSYGSTLDLLSGLARATGYDESKPIWSSSNVNYPDQIVALVGATMVVYCIGSRTKGVHLDISQLEVVAWTLADQIAAYMVTGQQEQPAGNRRPNATPHDVYRCAGEEQWVAIACLDDSQRRALAAVIGAAVEARDEAWWFEHADEIDQAITSWTTRAARVDVIEALRAVGVPAAPVLSAMERVHQARFTDRRVVIANARDPKLPCKGFPFVMHEYVPPAPRPAPALGEHSAMVGRLLGLADENAAVTFTLNRN